VQDYLQSIFQAGLVFPVVDRFERCAPCLFASGEEITHLSV
jgi:hypothetical protein